MRKILSPDLPDQDMQSVPSSPVQRNTPVPASGAIEDEAPMACMQTYWKMRVAQLVGSRA